MAALDSHPSTVEPAPMSLPVFSPPCLVLSISAYFSPLVPIPLLPAALLLLLLLGEISESGSEVGGGGGGGKKRREGDTTQRTPQGVEGEGL